MGCCLLECVLPSELLLICLFGNTPTNQNHMHEEIKNMSSSLLWDVTQRRLVVTDVSGQPIGPNVKGQTAQEECREHLRSFPAFFLECLTLQDGTNMLSRNVGNYLLRCVRSQKSEDFIYTAAEA